MLATLLPGYRHIRAPLLAGYVWLFVAIFVCERAASLAAVEALSDVAAAITPVAFGAASGVLAHLVGSASQALFGGAGESGGVGGLIGLVFGSLWRQCQPTPSRRALATGLHTPLSARCVQRLADLGRDRAVARADIHALRTRLLLSCPALFAEVDRLRSEAELRFALAVPLCAAATALAFVPGEQRSLLWLIALLLPIALCVQGRDRLGSSNGHVVDAAVLGLISWPRWSSGASERVSRTAPQREVHLDWLVRTR